MDIMDNITEGLINNIILTIMIFAVLFSVFELHAIKRNTDQTKQDVMVIRRYIDSWEEIENSINYRKTIDN